MRIDSKGKYYTARVSTEELDVLLLTREGLIEGRIHIHPDRRLSDELNNVNMQFLAITDATVRDPAGSLLYKTHFLALNKNSIVWVIPNDAVESEDD